MAKSWALSNWQTGQVTLLQAFGISGQFTMPQLGSQLPAASASAQQQATTPVTGTAPANAQTYTQAQLQQLWVQAGGNPAYALIASAIAMAESGGRSNATDNDSNGTTDEGLWQINTVHGSLATYDPLGNARAAVQLSANGTNWTPWVTYKTGAYTQYM